MCNNNMIPVGFFLPRYGQNAITIHQSGGVALLLPLIGDTDLEMQEAAAGCINNIRKIALANDMQRTRKGDTHKCDGVNFFTI